MQTVPRVVEPKPAIEKALAANRADGPPVPAPLKAEPSVA